MDTAFNDSASTSATWSTTPELQDIANTDSGMIAELPTLFLDDSAARLQTLCNACVREGFKIIRAQAHSFKGSALRMGLFLFMLLSTPAFSQVLLTLSTGTSPAYFTGQGTSLGTYRIEARIESLAPSQILISNGQSSGDVNCFTSKTLSLTCTQGADQAPDGAPTAQLAEGQDVRMRFQRDAGGESYTLETWSGNCRNYFRQQLPFVPSAVLLPEAATWNFSAGEAIAFVRAYSTLDTGQDCPLDAPALVADLFDFTFEGDSLSDRSPNHYSMIAPGAAFTSSASYPPLAAITGLPAPQPVVVAGHSISVNGASSTAFTYPGTGGVSSYLWQQLSGPAESALRGITMGLPAITPPVPGQYSYQLTVSDSTGKTDSITQAVGVVATNNSGVTTPADPGLASVLGSSVPDGMSPWPWFDATEAADVNLLAPLMMASPTETAGPGTCSIPSGLPNQISQGYITEKAFNGVAIVCTGSGFSQADVGSRIVLNWDSNGDGSYKGRFITYINQVVSATEVIGNQYAIEDPVAAMSGQLSWGRLGADYGPYNAGDPNSFILMFYDAGLAVARLYQRTQLTAYQTQFHAFCDNWWHWALDSGYGGAIPRNSGLHSMIACASDPSYNAPPGMWDGIARLTQNIEGYIATSAGSEFAYNPTDTVIAGAPDIRENSYILRPTALLAKLYGNHGGNTAAWCGYLAHQLTNLWLADAAVPEGATNNNYAYWQENLFLNNIGYVAASHPAGDPNGRFGTSPWRSVGLPSLALIYSYEALSDASTCNNPTLANQLYNPADGSGLIANAANYVWDYGRAADGGILYAEGYETDTGNTLGWTVFNSTPASGVVTVSGTSVTGSGTYFTAQFGPCDGSTTILINGATYGVTSCIDDTHLTLNNAYPGSAATMTSAYSNPATITATNGSTAITGAGTKFKTLFAPCDGTTYIGIVGNANSYVDRRVYQVTGCADDAHLTLNMPYAGPSESGLNVFSRAHKAISNCGPMSQSSRCEPDRYDGRNLTSDIAASSAWLFAKTGNALWKQRAEYYANKLFGGASAGAGSFGSPTGTSVYSRPGTISMTAGNSVIVGSGTQFTGQFACNGTDTITLADQSGGFTWANYPGLNPTYFTLPVVSCADDTHLTLGTVYPGSSGTKVAMFYNANDPEWQGADGGTGNLGEVLPVCGSNAPPCGIGDMVPKYGKPLGMASGAGDVPTAFGNLVTTPVTKRKVPTR